MKPHLRGRIRQMQGRLVEPEDGRFQSFPAHRWRHEVELARSAGLDGIEWIFDDYQTDLNPVASREGCEALRNVLDDSDVRVDSVCADYFMSYPLLDSSAAVAEFALSRLLQLIGCCDALELRYIVLPFVDASRIARPEEDSRLVNLLRWVLAETDPSSVELHLETDLPPERFAALIREVGHSRARINYDLGNSAALGYSPDSEFEAYGEFVGSVHIKDRIKGGASVRLGTGSVDFPAVCRWLRRLDYSGDFVLQAARGVIGDEFQETTRNVDWLSKLLIECGLSTSFEVP